MKNKIQLGLVLGIATCIVAQPEVNTSYGPVRGVWLKTARDAEVAGFLGLPYAEPPIGSLRFEKPVPLVEKWTEVRNATSDGPMCMQKSEESDDVVGSEDCLYLNVFTPVISKNQTETQQKNLSVMVFIHGGGFNMGSSNSTLFAPTYLLDHDIILVTMNYRLNVLGFFSTGSDDIPGNYGLKDIVAALRWVQENIAAFGGNPKSVTLVGHSSGAAAAHLLSASKATEGLFHKMITMAGSAIASWAFHSRAEIRNSSLDIAKHLGCDGQDEIAIIDDPGSGDGETETNSTVIEEEEDGMAKEMDTKILNCMKKANPVDIVNWGYYYVWRHNPVCIFGPTLESTRAEDAILTVHPQRSLSEGLFRDMPWITGVTDDEGLLKTADLFLVSEIRDELLQDFERLLPYVLEMEHAIDNATAFAKAIEDFYFDGDVAANLQRNITQLVGDGLITYSSYEALQRQIKTMKSNAYFYLFAYEGTFSHTFRSGIPFRFGSSHGDDLNYIFPYLNEKYADLQLFNTMADRTIINIMTEMFVNFVKTGVPSARLTSSWESYQDHRRFIRFGNGHSSDRTMETDFLPERMAFWSELWSNYSVPINEYVVEEERLPDTAGVRSTVGIEYVVCVCVAMISLWTTFLY